MGVRERGIEFDSLVSPADSGMVETVRTDKRKAKIGLRVVWIPLESFLEQIVRVGVVEALVQQQAPTNAVQRVAVGLRNGKAKLIARVLIHPESPIPLGAMVWIALLRKRLKAGVRLGFLAVFAQRGARAGGRFCSPGDLRSREDHHAQQRRFQPAIHLSISSST